MTETLFKREHLVFSQADGLAAAVNGIIQTLAAAEWKSRDEGLSILTMSTHHDQQPLRKAPLWYTIEADLEHAFDKADNLIVDNSKQ